jgi:hypothetical protein
VLDYFFVGKRSSTVAIAALLNAFEDQRCCEDLSAFIAPEEVEIVRDCQSRLRDLYNVPDQSVFDAQDSAAQHHTSLGRTSSPTCVTQNIM